MDRSKHVELVALAIKDFDLNEELHSLAVAKTARYFDLMDYGHADYVAATETLDNPVYTIYYAYKLDIEEGPIEA